MSKATDEMTSSLWRVRKVIDELDQPRLGHLETVTWSKQTKTNPDRWEPCRPDEEGAELMPAGTILVVEVTKLPDIKPGDIVVSEFRRATDAEIAATNPVK